MEEERAADFAADGSRIAEIDARLAGQDRTRAEIASRGGRTVVAPIDGTVAALLVQPGGNVAAGQTLVSVLPREGSLEAEVYVPSRHAGFVRVGQHASINYDAFSYHRFGAAKGTIRQVSQTVLAASEISDDPSTQPALRVRISLNRSVVEAQGSSFPIQPGMDLEARIVVGRRTFAQFLLRR